MKYPEIWYIILRIMIWHVYVNKQLFFIYVYKIPLAGVITTLRLISFYETCWAEFHIF